MTTQEPGRPPFPKQPMIARLATALLLATAALAAQDPLTVQATKRIAEVETLAENLEPGDAQRAALYLNKLAWAGKRLNVVSDKSDSHWKDAKARYDALWAAIEAKRDAGKPAGGNQPPVDRATLVQLDKDVRNAYENYRILSPKHLTDEFRVKSITAEIEKLRARVAKLSQDHADVKTIAGNLDIFEKAFRGTLDRLAANRGDKAAVDARLAELSAKYRSANQPGVLEHPFSASQLQAWAAEMRRFREQELPQDLAWLDTAAQNATVDQNKVVSMRHWLAGTWRRNLDEVEKQVRERVASDVATGLDAAKFVLETKVDDRHHVLNRILGKGRFDEQMTWLENARHAVAMAKVYDAAMGAPAVFGPTIRGATETADRPAPPDRDAQAATVERAIARMRELAKLALDSVRLPQAATNDPKLLKIAAETLRRPEYEITGWETLVINTDVTRKTRREAWAKGETTGIRIDYYEYVWDEYQVTTVEKVGDELWLFANTLKHYHSGDPTTPVGKWILSRRFELTPILPEHAKS